MTKPLDPAAKLGLKVLLVIGALFMLTEVIRLVLTIVYLIRGDLDGLSTVLLMLLYLSFMLLAVRLMSKGLRRLRQDEAPARQ